MASPLVTHIKPAKEFRQSADREGIYSAPQHMTSTVWLSLCLVHLLAFDCSLAICLLTCKHGFFFRVHIFLFFTFWGISGLVRDTKVEIGPWVGGITYM